ncbi:hypothetical protein [Bradyrhizobium sp.]|uniref:hypothetical protein n=1 Tax=Bradyrhizobium sp. TaxID=376 RepID=UPI003D0CBD21
MTIIERDIAIAVPNTKMYLIQRLKLKCPGPKTGAQLPGGQQLPGEAGPVQLAVGVAG